MTVCSMDQSTQKPTKKHLNHCNGATPYSCNTERNVLYGISFLFLSLSFSRFFLFIVFKLRVGHTKSTIPFLGGAFTMHGVLKTSLISEKTWTWESKHKHMYSHPGNGFQKGVGAGDPPPHAMWALATISHLTHPLTPSRHHMSPPVPNITKLRACRLLFLTNKISSPHRNP